MRKFEGWRGARYEVVSGSARSFWEGPELACSESELGSRQRVVRYRTEKRNPSVPECNSHLWDNAETLRGEHSGLRRLRQMLSKRWEGEGTKEDEKRTK